MHERGAVSVEFGDGASRNKCGIVVNGGMTVRNPACKWAAVRAADHAVADIAMQTSARVARLSIFLIMVRSPEQLQEGRS